MLQLSRGKKVCSRLPLDGLITRARDTYGGMILHILSLLLYCTMFMVTIFEEHSLSIRNVQRGKKRTVIIIWLVNNYIQSFQNKMFPRFFF